MNRGVFGGVAAGHRAGANFAAIVIHVVVAIHRWSFGSCGGVMVSGDRTPIASTARARSHDQTGHQRSLQQESRDETQDRLYASVRE